MIIELYKNNSDNNVVNKNITKVGELDVRLKEPVERENPQILVSGHIDDSYDYLYIPEFSRYYYVEYKRQYSENVYLINARIDVLKSFRDKILQARALVNHSGNLNNNYINDSTWVADVRNTTHIKNFTNGFNDEPTFVLITAGATI